MNVIILGAGHVGFQLARQLGREGKQVTIIERDIEEARRTADRLDCRVVTGEGNSLPILRKAGIEQADFFVSVAASDEVNMIACGLVVAEYPELITIARVRNVAYSMSRMVKSQLYGIDHIINPEIETARAVIRSLERGAVATVYPFAGTELSMTSLTVEESCPLANTKLRDIRASLPSDFLLPLIVRNERSFLPSGNTSILPDDLLYVIAGNEGTDALMQAAGFPLQEIKHIAIAGGGRIGRYIADHLLGKNDKPFQSTPWSKIKDRFLGRLQTYHVHFIEQDYVKGHELAETYPSALVTHSDISDEEVAEAGLLDNYDLLISATGNQDLNLVSALYAKKLGIKRTIALVRKASYISMAREMGVDVTVSITDTMVNSILGILRKGNISSLHSLAGGDFEIIEFLLDEESPLTGKKIKNLNLPKSSLILLITRDEKSFLPKGELEILSGDRLVIISPREGLKKLEETVAGS